MNMGIKYYFWYVRDVGRKPIITVCLAHDEDNNIFARGIAICTMKDNTTKKEGRKIAKGRAMKALGTQKDGDIINLDRIAGRISRIPKGVPYINSLINLEVLSQYKPSSLSEDEIFSMAKERKVARIG
jgi:hypothetical protein